MNGPANGFELLERLRKQNGRPVQNYSDLFRFLAFKAREKGVPFSGQFELTPLCNFDCKMCYVHLGHDQLNVQSILSVDKWKDLIHQAWEAGMVIVSLTGGECLTYPGFEELYIYLHELGCQVNVLTNGYLINEKTIDLFRKHGPAKIQISLYGQNDDVYERVTGKRAFTTVRNNILKLLDAHMPVSISVTPSIYFFEDAIETMRMVIEEYKLNVSVNNEIFIPREETGRANHHDNLSKEDYLKISRKMNEISGIKMEEIPKDKLPPYGSDVHECNECGLRCGGGRSGFVIDWKGTMVPCNRLDMIKAYPLDEGFQSAWKKINTAANNWPRIPECKGCAYRDVCSVCAAEALEYAEPGKQPIGLCEKTKYKVEHGVKHIPECEDEVY